MKLTYRGIEYDYNPPMLEIAESEIVGQYRGQQTRYTYVRHVPIPQPAERLSYRGVAYETTRHGQIQQLTVQNDVLQSATQPVTRPGTALTALRSKLTGTSHAAQVRRELLEEASQHHQQSIARSLRHRIEVAKAQGNQFLVQQLESEMHQNV
ncbi:MAG: DUF4278 domain-containing protein [Cyanobacteria bacterium J06621_11]